MRVLGCDWNASPGRRSGDSMAKKAAKARKVKDLNVQKKSAVKVKAGAISLNKRS